MSHSNRSKKTPKPGDTPKPEDVARAREVAGLTQTKAGEVIYGSLRAWQDYESGARRLHPGLYELFLAKTGQMPKAFYEGLNALKERDG